VDGLETIRKDVAEVRNIQQTILDKSKRVHFLDRVAHQYQVAGGKVRLKVAEVLPRWSGDVLDLVVDFVTYVFVPAYAIAAGGLFPEALAVPAAMVVVITGALYFADRTMKTADNYFRGFPALWNAAAFYLFVLKPPPWLATAVVVILAVLSFAPFKFVHPFRVARLRAVSIGAVILWAVLAVIAVVRDLDPGPWVAGGLLVIGLYFLGVGLTARTEPT
jgi:phosphatidylcholine synthase